MFAYLFFIAATAVASELPIANTPKSQESQEIVTLVAQDRPTEETIEEKKLIIVTNAIKPDMLAYKHWTGTYNPDSFTVFINDTEIAQGAELNIPAETKTVNVRFDYSFVNGMRKGTKTVSYKLNDDITQAQITFSWKDDNKIILDNGTVMAT